MTWQVLAAGLYDPRWLLRDGKQTAIADADAGTITKVTVEPESAIAHGYAMWRGATAKDEAAFKESLPSLKTVTAPTGEPKS